MLSRKDISNKLNLNYSKIKRSFNELNIRGTVIKGVVYYTDEEAQSLKMLALAEYTYDCKVRSKK